MLVASDPDHILHVQFLTLSPIKRPDARIDVRAESSQLLHVIYHLPADVLLIGFRQSLDFGHCLFQRVCHSTEYNTERRCASAFAIHFSPNVRTLSLNEHAPPTSPQPSYGWGYV